MPTINIRWADNTEQLRNNLKQGIDQIEATRASAEKMARSLGGDNLIRAANNYVAAVNQIGGANKLTADRQEQVNRVVTKAIEQYTVLGKTAPAAMVALAEATKKAEAPTAGLSTGLGKIGDQALAMATGFITAQAAMAAVKGGVNALTSEFEDLVMHGSAVSDVTANFERLTTQVGLTGSALLGALRQGTHNTIDDFELMKKVNQDLAAGMRLTDQQFGTLSKGAFALAQATGTDVKTAFDTMNDAMLTGRTRALAELTGKVNLTDSEKKYAESLRTTAEHLTDEGKLEAARATVLDLVSVATERLGEQTDGLDEHVAQAQTAWANFHNELGKTVAESPVIEAGFKAIEEAIASALGSNQEELVQNVTRAIEDIAIKIPDVIDFIVTLGVTAAEVFDGIQRRAGSVGAALRHIAVGTTAGAAMGAFAGGVGAVPGAIIGAGVGAFLPHTGTVDPGESEALKAVEAAAAKSAEATALMRQRMIEARDASRSFVGPLQDVATATGAAAAAAGNHANLVGKSKKEISEAEAEAKKFADAMVELSSASGDYLDIVDSVDGSVREAIRFYLQAGVAQNVLAAAYDLTATQVKALATQLTEEQKALKANSDLAKAVAKEQSDALAKAGKDVLDNLKIQNEAEKEHWDSVAKLTLSAVDYQLAQVDRWEAEEKAKLDKRTINYEAAEAAIVQAAKDRRDEIARLSELENVKISYEFVGPVSGGPASGPTMGTQIKTGFEAAVKDFPQILIHAFEGGGDLLGALKAIGVKVADAIVTPILDGIETATTKMKAMAAGVAGGMAGIGTLASGGSGKRAAANTALAAAGVASTAIASGATIAGAVALGAATFGIGLAAIGAYVAIKKLFGMSKEEKEGRAVVKDFEKQFSSTTDMINKVGDAYRANGKTAEQAQAAIKRLWAAEKLGAEATKKALEEINEELKRHQEITDAIASEGFQSQDEIMHAADIANAAYEEMLRSGKYTQAQVEEAYRKYQELLAQLEGAAGEAARAWLEAHKAADGAAAASSDAMQSAEADLKGLIDQRNALAKGIAAEAPEEVMGVIEQQQRGQLAALDKEIQDKADAYAKLADETGQKMADAIVEALKNIHIDPIHIGTIVDAPRINNGEQPEPVSRGGVIRSSGVGYFAGGYMPTMPSFRPIGTDIIPAMLTPGEMVLTASQQAAIGSLLAQSPVSRGGNGAGGAGGPDSIVYNVNIHATDAQSFERLMRTKGAHVVVERIALGKDGLRETLKRGLDG